MTSLRPIPSWVNPDIPLEDAPCLSYFGSSVTPAQVHDLVVLCRLLEDELGSLDDRWAVHRSNDLWNALKPFGYHDSPSEP